MPVYQGIGIQHSKSLIAEADLSTCQHYYVKESATGGCVLAGAATGEIGLGFLVNFPKIGEVAEITGPGPAIGQAAAPISGPQIPLKAVAGGYLSPAVAGDIVSAISNESAVTGQHFEITQLYYQMNP